MTFLLTSDFTWYRYAIHILCIHSLVDEYVNNYFVFIENVSDLSGWERGKNWTRETYLIYGPDSEKSNGV